MKAPYATSPTTRGSSRSMTTTRGVPTDWCQQVRELCQVVEKSHHMGCIGDFDAIDSDAGQPGRAGHNRQLRRGDRHPVCFRGDDGGCDNGFRGRSPVVDGLSSGHSTVSWNTTITVFAPTNSAAGLSGTITHSVACLESPASPTVAA